MSPEVSILVRQVETLQRELKKARLERDSARRDLAFAEARKEPRDFVTVERAKQEAAKLWGAEVANRLFFEGF